MAAVNLHSLFHRCPIRECLLACSYIVCITAIRLDAPQQRFRRAVGKNMAKGVQMAINTGYIPDAWRQIDSLYGCIEC